MESNFHSNENIEWHCMQLELNWNFHIAICKYQFNNSRLKTWPYCPTKMGSKAAPKWTHKQVMNESPRRQWEELNEFEEQQITTERSSRCRTATNPGHEVHFEFTKFQGCIPYFSWNFRSLHDPTRFRVNELERIAARIELHSRAYHCTTN